MYAETTFEVTFLTDREPDSRERAFLEDALRAAIVSYEKQRYLTFNESSLKIEDFAVEAKK